MPKRAINWPGLFQEQRGCREWDHTPLVPRFPSLSELVFASQFLWPVVSVVYLCCGEENRRKGPTLCLIKPLPELLATLAQYLRWFSFFIFRVTWFWFFLLFCTEQHFICVLTELFPCILYGFSLFSFLFLNYAWNFVCVKLRSLLILRKKKSPNDLLYY